MNARPFGLRQNFAGTVDVFRIAACESGDDGSADRAAIWRTPSASSSDAIGKQFDDIHAKGVQFHGEPDLLRGPHRKAWRLFAVAQRVSKIVTALQSCSLPCLLVRQGSLLVKSI